MVAEKLRGNAFKRLTIFMRQWKMVKGAILVEIKFWALSLEDAL